MASSSNPIRSVTPSEVLAPMQPAQRALSTLATNQLDQLLDSLSSQTSPRSIVQATLPGDEKVKEVVSNLSPTLLTQLAQTEKARRFVQEAAHHGREVDLSALHESFPEARLKLTDLVTDPPLKIKIGQTTMHLDLTNTTIGDRENIESQLKDPRYHSELLKHLNKNHYSIHLRDLNKEEPADLAEAKAELARIQQDPTAGEDDALMAWITVESLMENFNKPSISLRFAEDGSIGEVRSIESQSTLCSGSAIMKALIGIGAA